MEAKVILFVLSKSLKTRIFIAIEWKISELIGKL